MKKNMIRIKFGSIFLVVLISISWIGCSSKSTRTPGPLYAIPAENVDQQVPPSMRPEISSEKKLDPEYLQSQASYHFSLGQAYSLEGNPDKAIDEYKSALIYDPQSAIIHTRLAGEYVKKGLLTFAIDECKYAIKLDEKYIDARLLLAGLYSSTRLVHEAIVQYDAILKIDSKNNEAYVFKASLLIDDEKNTEAIEVLKKLLTKDPDFFWAYYYIGRAYQKMSKSDLAIINYKKALQLKPNFPQAGLMLGVLYEEARKTKEAIEVYEELYKYSGDSQAVARLAQIYIEKDDLNKALKYLLVLEQNDEENLNARVKIGLIYVQKKLYDRAIDTFTSILSKNKDAERVRFYLASVYKEVKKYDDALDSFKMITASSSLYIDSLVHIADILRIKGDINSAIQTAEKGIEENPDSTQLYLFKASLLEDLKKFPEAVAFLEKTRQRFPKDESILYYLGSIYDKQNNQDKGIETMSELLRINPENVQALNYLGYTFALRGEQMQKAEEYILKAMKLKPNDGYITDSYGFYLLKKGEVKKAALQLEKAYRLKPTEPVISEHLGDAYLRLNMKQKALEKYKEADRLYSQDEKADRIEVEKLNKKIKELEKRS